MTNHKIVSKEKWLEQRRVLLEKEKAFTKQQDELTKLRLEMPWEKVEKTYEFDGPNGKVTLAELFDGKSQLIIYHFMFEADWTEGCKSCSLLADHYEPSIVHLKQRDTNMVTISHASLEKIEAFRKRMGWNFTWVSSEHSDFNFDYQVSFAEETREKGEVNYNYGVSKFFSTEGPGLSVFFKDEDETIYHTYSTFARGLEAFLSIYRLLDIAPKGRDEANLTYGMEWVRHHDRYGDTTFVDPYVKVFIGSKKQS